MSWFRSRARSASTGHAGDDQVLAEIAKRSDLQSPREWEHFLYFADVTGARSAAEEIHRSGWDVREPEEDDDGQWLIVAKQTSVVTSPETAMRARQFFEGIAAARPGAKYDGWGALAE